MEKVEILYVVSATLPNERAHGIQIVNTCAGLSKAGASVELITPFFFGSQSDIFSHYRLPKCFQHKKLPAFDIPHLKHRFQIRSLSFFFSSNVYLLFRILSGFLKRKKIIIYTRGETVFSLYLISFFIDVYFETHQIRNHEQLYIKILKRVKGLIVITNNLRKKFVEEYGLPSKKIVVARDAVDVSKFAEVTCSQALFLEHGVPKDKKLVLYCGSLTKEKGVFTLAGAAQELDGGYHIVFIGGHGKELEKFKDLYGSLENVSILGSVDHEVIPAYLSCATLVVQPDLAKDTYANLFTSPMKLFEYMASGKPIMAANVPSIEEVLSYETAVFFKSGDPHSLAEVINNEAVMTDTYKEKGKKASNEVNKFTWDKRGVAILDYLERTSNQ